MKSISGFVERYDASRVSGWADIEIDGNDSILELCIDGFVIGEVVPSISRPDINNRKIGFSFDLKKGDAPNKACRLEVRTKGSKTHLGNSPVVVLLANEESKKEVVEGRDGYLFLANGSNRVIDQIQGNYLLSHDFFEKWESFAKELNNFSNQGIDCRFLVVPNKECVFDCHLPNGISLVPNRPLSSLVRVLAENWMSFYSSFSYPIGVLRGAPYGMTYTPGDTHWTTYGAWCGVEEMFRDQYRNEIDAVSNLVNSCPKKMRFENSDLLSKLGGDCVELKPIEPQFVDVKQVFDNNEINTGSRSIWRCNNPGVKKVVLIYHDSFGPPMFKYLAKVFGEVHTVWLPNISKALVDEISPDILIVERVERFLILPSEVL